MIEERVKVRLRVNIMNELLGDISLPKGKYFLAVTGPGLQLGFDDYNKAPRMIIVGRDSTVWTKDLWIVKNSVLQYKYIVIQRYTNEVLHQETIAKREIDVRTQQIVIDDKYNRVTFHGQYRDTKLTSTRPNAYGLNNNTGDTRKANGSQNNGMSKVFEKACRQIVEQKQRDQVARDRGDVDKPKTNHPHKRTTPAHTASEDEDKKVKYTDIQVTKPSPCEGDNMMETNTVHLDEENRRGATGNFEEKFEYIPYMEVVRKLGLLAVAAFGIYRLISK